MAAAILVVPSMIYERIFMLIVNFRTCHYHSTTNSPRSTTYCCEINVHRVNDVFEVERNLNIENLLYL